MGEQGERALAKHGTITAVFNHRRLQRAAQVMQRCMKKPVSVLNKSAKPARKRKTT
jgi:hypothetical protein